MKLTAKQRKFINEYLKCFNAAEAARRAGYSERTARYIGCENLTKPNIAAAIKKHFDQSAMSRDEVLSRLGDMGRASIEDFTTVIEGVPNGLYLDMEKARAAGKLHVIRRAKYDSEGRLEIELHDSQAALDKLARAHGLYNDKLEVTGEGGAPIAIAIVSKERFDDI